MWSSDQPDRRTAARPLRTGAMRCGSCGTTWFDQLTAYVRGLQQSCHRCGGELHTERRSVAAARAVRAA